MGFSFRAKAGKNCKESWGMGFLLVLFPEESPNSTAINVDKPSNTKLFPSCSASTPQMNTNANIRRSNSNRLLTKAQSTISICALLVFVTLLLFTLSTFEPNNRTSPSSLASRRFLAQNRGRSLNSSSSGLYWSRMWKNSSSQMKKAKNCGSKPQKALQGLGTLYRRGTKSMADLVVAHVKEDPNDDELRIFLRALHRSGLTSKSDVVLLFPSSSSQSKHDSLIHQENDSFFKLLQSHRDHNQTSSSSSSKRSSLAFDVTQFKPGKKPSGEAIWGKKGSSSFSGNDSESELARLSFGSVVGFEASELDPENSLSGFFTELAAVPMSLRRWACYPMLLGRVRRNFKHVLLVDAKSVVVLGDQLGHVRNLSPESVHFYARPESVSSNSKHGKRNSDKAQPLNNGVNSAVIAGGAKGIRRLSAAMLTEIVRAATAAGQHKRKGPAVTESGVLSQLVGNEFLLSDVQLVKTGDSVPEASELGRAKSKHSVVQCGNNGNGHEVIKSVIMKQICSNDLDSFAYRDCHQKS